MVKTARILTDPIYLQFSALLEQEIPPPDAAERLGIPRRKGTVMMTRLRDAMGPQAK